MSSALSRATSAVLSRPATAFGVRLAKRHASAAFAHMKVKKQNWVEQNEIVRENQFYNWTIGKHNLFPLLFMTVLFPVWFHGMYKGELETRDIKMNKHEKPLERL